MPPKPRKLIIAGPGRSGSTLLVQILTKLGFDTGIERLKYYPAARAGLEAELLDPCAPRVVKDPSLTERLPRLLATGAVSGESIERVILPVRDLGAVAKSRLAQSVDAGEWQPPGGLWRARSQQTQRALLEEMFYELIRSLAEHEVPFTAIAYPRFARDWLYAYRTLAPILDSCPPERFSQAWHSEVDESLVHDLADLKLSLARRIRWRLNVYRSS